MYLKRLEMVGFKSFAARTLLEFSPGVTAVIGPNGAGKSNVADAMRWVLGEQSMRQLRGKKSDDIIFAGANGKAALGMAEVSLTLDNSTGWVPSEYSEITVTRRSFRSGENEYLINKQRVRLKDVLLLLAQARIGHDSYTVVGQGLIDAALSLRAEERRSLFEDAAGIRPFQVQRSDAENRLRMTEQNIARLRDIVGEIEPRLQPLQDQARKATEYAMVNDELQEVLSAWYALQWRRLRATQEQAEQVEQEQARHVTQFERTLVTLQERSDALRGTRQQIQNRIVTTRQSHDEAVRNVQRIERDLAVSEERVGGLEQQRTEMQREERRLRERAIAVRKQIIDGDEQCSLADEAVDTESASLAALESQVVQAQKEYEMDQRRVRNAQNDLVQMQARLGSSQTELGRVQKQLGERNRTLAGRRELIAQAQQVLRNVEARIHDERGRLHTARNEEQQVVQRRQALGRIISDAQQEVDHLKTTIAEAERQRRTLTERLTMLKNWRQNLGGYADGVRSLLRAPTGNVAGLLGPIPQLGVAPPGMEMALETALGPYVQAVVVRTQNDAKQCLSYLNNKSKAMVVWLERGDDKDEKAREARRMLQETEETILARFLAERSSLREDVLGFAWRHMQCEAQYVVLFHRILRGIVLARHIEAAQELLAWVLPLSLSSTNDLPFHSIVTLKGEQLHVDGWFTSSGKESSQQGLLVYERELHELPQQVEQQRVTLDQYNSMLSEVHSDQEGRRIEQASLDKELQRFQHRINELNRIVTASQRELERTQTEIQVAASVEQQVTSEVKGLGQEAESIQERVRNYAKSQRELSALVEELQQEMEERSSTFHRQQDAVGKARTLVAVKRQEAKALHQQVALLSTQSQDFEVQIGQQVGRRQEAEQKQQALRESIVHARSERDQAQAHAHNAEEALRTVETQFVEVEQQLTLIEQQRVQAQQRKTEQEVVYRRALLESQRSRDNSQSLLEQLREEMGIDDPRDLLDRTTSMKALASESVETPQNGHLSEDEEAELRRLRRRVETLRGRLKSMGGFDINAPQLYEETRTRYEFLSSQIVDMDQASTHLRSIIEQLDVSMARQFELTFQAVNAHFRDHFTTLFNGGTAHLELVAAKVDESDEGERAPTGGMPAGVEVIVQPPGKKVQDLALLSGGERALVSAALLFSLLEINPPPFCLLDEVDAALDESNVTRFCDILKKLAQRTQFIVITHNRVTMTIAQVLYGVSMRDSVSRMLSLRVEEAVAVGDR